MFGTTNLQISPWWYDNVHFGHMPSWFCFWFHPKGLIPLEIVVLPYKPMIIPLFNRCGTLIAFPPNNYRNKSSHILALLMSIEQTFMYRAVFPEKGACKVKYTISMKNSALSCKPSLYEFMRIPPKTKFWCLYLELKKKQKFIENYVSTGEANHNWQLKKR